MLTPVRSRVRRLRRPSLTNRSPGVPASSAIEVNVGLVGVGVVGSAVADYFARGPLELRLPGSPFGAPTTVRVKLWSAARRSRSNGKSSEERLSGIVSRDSAGRPRFYHDAPAKGVAGGVPAWRKVVGDPQVDIVVELTGSPLAETVMEEALWSGKSVVTANKTVLARSGYELVKLAQARGVSLAYEASVGGGMPIVQTIASSVGARVNGLLAIINGTTNFILTCMEEDAARALGDGAASYPAAVCAAVHGGLAEADPGADVLGEDPRSKLIVLAGLAFGVRLRLQDVYVRGIARRGVLRGPAASERATYHRCPQGLANCQACAKDDHLTTQPVLTLEDLRTLKQFGYVPKLLAGAQMLPNGRLAAWVQPCAVPATHPLARVTGSENACLLAVDSPTENGVREFDILLRGPGAGGPETASSVIADIEFCARQIAVARRHEGNPSLYMYGGDAFDRPQAFTGRPTMLESGLKTPFLLRFSGPAATNTKILSAVLGEAGIKASVLNSSANYLRTEPATLGGVESGIALVLKELGAVALSLDVLYLPLLEGARWL